MPLIQSKQISKLVAGRVAVTGYAFTAGAGVSSFNATTNLTTALATAGEGGVAVPLQSYIAGTQPGLVTSGANLVEIYDSATKAKLTDGTAANNEVYGRLTFAAATYTVSLFVNVAGTETAFVPAANITIDIVAPYVFTFATLPADFATSLKASYVGDDPAAAGNRIRTETVAVTALNTLANLTAPYSTGPAQLIVNGQVISSLSGGFTLTGGSNAVTWVAATAGFNLVTTDEVIAVYPF